MTTSRPIIRCSNDYCYCNYCDNFKPIKSAYLRNAWKGRGTCEKSGGLVCFDSHPHYCMNYKETIHNAFGIFGDKYDFITEYMSNMFVKEKFNDDLTAVASMRLRTAMERLKKEEGLKIIR